MTTPTEPLVCRFCGNATPGEVVLYPRYGGAVKVRVMRPECWNIPACKAREQAAKRTGATTTWLQNEP